MKTHVCTFRLLDSERGNEEGVMQKEMSAQVFSESVFLSLFTFNDYDSADDADHKSDEDEMH